MDPARPWVSAQAQPIPLLPHHSSGQNWEGQNANETSQALLFCSTSHPPIPLHAGELGAMQADIDYEALIKAVDEMEPTQFASVDMDKLVAQYTRSG